MVVKVKGDTALDQREQAFGLVNGKVYVVFAMSIGPRQIQYCVIVNEVSSSYPKFFSADLFEIVDASMPDDWLISEWRWQSGGANDIKDNVAIAIGPANFSQDSLYYSALVDAAGKDEIQLEYNKIRDKYLADAAQYLKQDGIGS